VVLVAEPARPADLVLVDLLDGKDLLESRAPAEPWVQLVIAVQWVLVVPEGSKETPGDQVDLGVTVVRVQTDVPARTAALVLPDTTDVRVLLVRPLRQVCQGREGHVVHRVLLVPGDRLASLDVLVRQATLVPAVTMAAPGLPALWAPVVLLVTRAGPSPPSSV